MGMPRYYTGGRVAIWTALLCGWLFAPHITNGEPARTSRGISLCPRGATEVLQCLPFVFEPNLGQPDPRVLFLTRAEGMASFLPGRQNVMGLTRRRRGSDPVNPTENPEIESIVALISPA